MIRSCRFSLLLVATLVTLAHADTPSEQLKRANEAAEIETKRSLKACRTSKSLEECLRSLPCVKSVETNGPSKPEKTVLHLRDWHFVPRDVFDADIRSVNNEPVSDKELDKLYEEFLLEVENL